MKRTRFKKQYWVVGATWAEDMYRTFITRGYWMSGYNEGDNETYDERLNHIRVGDRIAIKSMLGQGDSNIKIKAIGIVKDVDEDNTVYINWLLTDINRIVHSRGCYGTIHGPFGLKADDDWIGQVFRI